MKYRIEYFLLFCRKLTITINATGEVIELPDDYKAVLAFNFVIGTREFNGSAPFTFFGPGMSP